MNPSKETNSSLLDINALLLGIAPSEDNRGLVERHYLFGDAQQATASASSPRVTESLAFLLGLPPTESMCKVTEALYNIDEEPCDHIGFQTPQKTAMRAVDHPSPSFATPEYDVVKSVVDACSSTAERYARQLYHATHTSKKNSCAAKQCGVQLQESLTMPEELLGA